MITTRLRENAFLWLLTAGAVVALLAGIDAGRESRGFFAGIRFVVCFASSYAAVTAYKTRRETWTWLLGANAALYNPFLPVHLARGTWNLVDLADIFLVVAAAIMLRIRGEEQVSMAVGEAPAAAPNVDRQYVTPRRHEMALWIVLLAMCLCGVFLMQFYGAPEGAAESQKSALSTEIGTLTAALPISAYLVARMRRWRQPWRVALGVLLAGLATVFVAAATGG